MTPMYVFRRVIEREGLGGTFLVGRDAIACPANDSRIHFPAIVSSSEVRDWEGVDRYWHDDAQRLSVDLALNVIPTILRKRGAQAWFTFNPVESTDWVWQRFVVHPRPGDLIRKVSWRDNPYQNPQNEAERIAMRREDPALYRHVWEGELDPRV